MPSPASGYRRLADLDPLLRPQLATIGPPWRVALAVAMKAFSNDVSSALTATWLRSRGDTEMQRLVSSRKRWQNVSRQARAYLRQPPGSSGGAVARRLAGSLLTPVDLGGVSGRRIVTARAVFATVALGALDADMPTGLTTNSRLQVALDLTNKPVQGALKIGEQVHWLRPVHRQHRGATRWAMGRLDEQRGRTADRLHITVSDLADRGHDDALAETIRAIQHPAVAYGVGVPAWLCAVATAAEIDPLTLGLSKTGAGGSRKTWTRMVEGHGDLRDALDAFDRERGCTIERDRREAARIEEAASSARARAAHSRVMTAVDATMSTCPEPTAARAEISRWIMSVDGKGASVPVELKAQARSRIAAKMVRLGYGENAAAQVASRIVPGATEKVA